MKILFLDRSGKPGGAELCLLDIAGAYRDRCLVCLFADGSFRTMLEEEQIPVKVLGTSIIDVQKDSSTLQGLYSIGKLVPLAIEVARLSRCGNTIKSRNFLKSLLDKHSRCQGLLNLSKIIHLIAQRLEIIHSTTN